jgi:uncharacterized UPF0160 family protein
MQYDIIKDFAYRIVTHSGGFHADYVSACALLKTCFPSSTFIRSRNPADWEAGDIVLDVGSVYDHAKFLFDHHQQDDNLPTHPDGTPYSSFGMVFDKFGKNFISHVLAGQADKEDIQAATDYVFDTFKCRIVQPVDALDNGIAANSILPQLVSSFNLTWCESGDDMHAFLQAVDIVQKYLIRQVVNFYGDWKSRTKAKDIDRTITGLMILSEYFPWQDFTTDADLFVIFPRPDGNWALQTIPVSKGSFESKQFLPEYWLEDSPKDCLFVHKNRFIAVFKSQEAAISEVFLCLLFG